MIRVKENSTMLQQMASVTFPGINTLKMKVPNRVFHEWCNTLIQCQSDRSMKNTLKELFDFQRLPVKKALCRFSQHHVHIILEAAFPCTYLRSTAAAYKKHLNEELETAISVITTSYLRSGDVPNFRFVDDGLQFRLDDALVGELLYGEGQGVLHAAVALALDQGIAPFMEDVRLRGGKGALPS